LILLLAIPTVLAGCPCNSEPETEDVGLQGTGNQSGQGVQTENQGEEGSLIIQQRENLRVRNATEIRNLIQERKEEMDQNMESYREELKNIYTNQNRVRLAVHALLAIENLTGIGQNVSQIARECNNSVQATIRAEERIQKRNMLVKFFAGGDEEAAEEIEQEVNRNQERIQELKRLMQECDCNEELKAMIQEHIQNMEQEQNRLQELAENEKNSKGIFGWLWK